MNERPKECPIPSTCNDISRKGFLSVLFASVEVITGLKKIMHTNIEEITVCVKKRGGFCVFNPEDLRELLSYVDELRNSGDPRA